MSLEHTNVKLTACHRGDAHLAAGTVRFSAFERFGAAHLAWLAELHWR